MWQLVLMLFSLLIIGVRLRGTEATDDVVGEGQERTVYINGWELDTRLLPSIDNDPHTPTIWARRNEGEADGRALAEEGDDEANVVALVHVQPVMSAKKVREIEAYLGTSLGDYKANNTFVLAAPPDTARRAGTAPHVVWVCLSSSRVSSYGMVWGSDTNASRWVGCHQS